MIRPTNLDDTQAVLDLAVAAGLFPADATDEVAEILRNSLDGSLGPDHIWNTDDDDGSPVGIVYFAPERMTDATWNLYMIAVHPDRQREGRGAALVRHVEESLRSRGARMLLIETSSLAQFDRTRAFYRALDFQEEARIRDYYNEGEDKIIFRKVLNVQVE